MQHESTSATLASAWRAWSIRSIALLCACTLSVGSHFAQYILGPLKTRLSHELGTSHTQFSLFISATSLNSTWTPLIGGILASRLGTTLTSILSTGVILIGQAILLLGDLYANVRLMILGLFIFGLGVSPLAVVQETIIVRFFRSHGLGVSMALGLIAGKGSSFLAARISYPLTEYFGPHAPFYSATSLAALSFLVNIVYIAASKWLVYGSGAELEAVDIEDLARHREEFTVSESRALKRVAERRKVDIYKLAHLGDIFWVYIWLNVLCGAIWTPFTHLATNIIETRYHLNGPIAALYASYLLAGSVVLYPVCGLVVDLYRHRPIILRLMMLSSLLTLSAYVWLAFPPPFTGSPTLAIVTFAAGHGFSPLLLVLIVPKIVPSKYISTALGAHKCLEQTGSTLFQTFAGLILDDQGKHSGQLGKTGIQRLLNIFVLLNILHLSSILILASMHDEKCMSTDDQPQLAEDYAAPAIEDRTEVSRLLPSSSSDDDASSYSTRSAHSLSSEQEVLATCSEVRRGGAFAVLAGSTIFGTWIFFFVTVITQLRKSSETSDFRALDSNGI